MSSNDPFKLLELDRASSTDADVRRAYAKKLKVTRPDDDPEGFMELRRAFDQAREMLKWDAYYDDDEEDAYDDADDNEDEADASSITTTIDEAGPAIEAETAPAAPLIYDETVYAQDEFQQPDTVSKPEPDQSDPVPEHSYDETLYNNEDEPSHQPNLEPEPLPDLRYDETVYSSEPERASSLDDEQWEPPAPQLSPVDEVMNQIQAHFASPWGVGDIEKLKGILNDPSIEGLDEFTEFSQRVRWALCEATGLYKDEDDDQVEIPSWLSADVLLLLDNHFGWRAQQALDYNSRTQNGWVQKLFDTFTTLSRGQIQRGSDFNPQSLQPISDKPTGLASSAWIWAVWIVFFIAIVFRLGDS